MREQSRQIKGRAREALHGRYGIPMTVIGILLVIYLLVTAPFNYSLIIAQRQSSLIIYIIANILIFLVLFEAGIGISVIHLKLARGTSPHVKDLLYAFRNRPDRFIVVFLVRDGIFSLCLLPSFITMFMQVSTENIGLVSMLNLIFTLAGLIAGIILTAPFILTEYLMIDRGMASGLAALKESRRLMKGRRLSVLYLYASFIGYFILCLISYNIGFFWVAPYVIETIVQFYLDVTEQIPYEEDAEDIIVEG